MELTTMQISKANLERLKKLSLPLMVQQNRRLSNREVLEVAIDLLEKSLDSSEKPR